MNLPNPYVCVFTAEPGKSRADFGKERERILASLKGEEKESITAMAVEGTRIAVCRRLGM